MKRETSRPSRRRILGGAAGAAALGLAGLGQAAVAGEGRRITKGRIKQSIVQWCFASYWAPEAAQFIPRAKAGPTVIW